MNNENIRREFEEYMNVTDRMWLLINSDARKCARFLKEAEKSGQLDTYLQDFANASAFRTITIMKLGQSYVFCRNHTPIPYNQIAKAYQEKIKHNGIITSQFLVLKDSSGKQLIRALMLPEAEPSGELAQVMGFLKWKNPAIHLGYR